MRRLILFGVAALLVIIEITASLAWPSTVPRLSALPRPPSESWNDDCNGHPGNSHGVTWQRGLVFWNREEFSTLVECIPR